MKKYISAILVPCFLLQLLAGCYSYKEITLDELQKYYGSDDVKITTDKDKIVINRESTGNSKMSWKTKDSSIIIQSTELIRDSDDAKVKEKNYDINFRDIQSVELSEYDGLKTGLLIGSITFVVALIIAAVAWSQFMDSGWGNWGNFYVKF